MSPPPPPPSSPSSSECRRGFRRDSTAPASDEPHRSNGNESHRDTIIAAGIAPSSPLKRSRENLVVDVQGLGLTSLDRKDFCAENVALDDDGEGADGISSISHQWQCQTADDVSSLGDGNDGNISGDPSSDSSFSLSLSHPIFHLPASSSSAIVDDKVGGGGDDGTSNVSLQLSLPESFDDTFTIHGVPVSSAAGAAPRDDTRASRDRFPRKSINEGSRGDINEDNLMVGGRSGHADESATRRSALYGEWSEREKRALREALAGATFAPGAESQLRLDERDDDPTISELAVRLMRDRIAVERMREVDHNGEVQAPLRRRVEELEYELQEAARARTVAVDRLGATRRELEARDEANRRLEETVRRLRSDAVELREKGRQCGALEKRCQRAEGEAAELRRRIDGQSSALARATEWEEESMKKRLDAEGQLRAADGDAAVLRKEVAVLLERVERAEADRQKVDDRLREAQTDKEGLVRQLLEVKERIRADCDARVAREVSQIRTEQSFTGKDVEELRRHGAAATALERENRLLLDARRDLTKELDRVRNELTELRATHQDLVLHQSSMAADHERSLSQIREEIKTKELEIAKLSVARDALSGKLKAALLQNDHMRDQVLIHEKEFMKLENDASSERRRLEEELSRKKEQLETYLEAEIQIEAEIGDGQHRGAAGLLSDPRRRIQHTVEITRKCANLKKRHDELLSELENEKKENSELAKKVKVYEDLGTVDVRKCMERKDDEPRQQPKIETCATAKEPNAGELCQAFDRRAQLETMLGIVDELKTLRKTSQVTSNTPKRVVSHNSMANHQSNDQAYIASKPGSTPSKAKANMPNSRIESTQRCRHNAREVDLSIHTVHHKERVRQHRPWHYSPASR